MFKFITQFFRRKKQVKDDPWFKTILTKPIREKFVISIQEQQEQMTVTREFIDDFDKNIKLEECIHQCSGKTDNNTSFVVTTILNDNKVIKEIIKPV